MNLHFSFKAAKSADLENDIQQHVQKLEKRLQVFRPELIHLHGTLDHAPREAFAVSLNLRLPSGQLSAQSTGTPAAAVIKAAFSDLVHQLGRHKELLRSQHKWQRQKDQRQREVEPNASVSDGDTDSFVPSVLPPVRKKNGHATPAEITEAVFAEENRPNVQAEVRSYINANLPRLERFVTRELRFLESQNADGQRGDSRIAVNEVVDEVVVTALSAEQKPTQLPLERWLYRLAIQAIKRVATGDDDFDRVPLEQHVGQQNVTGSDEDFLQFHQPGGTLNREDVIADVRASNPEELAASDELIDQLETALHGVTREDREAFILYAIEGFTVDEIAQVTDHPPDEVRGAIKRSREHLGRKLPASHALKKKLLQHSSVA